MNTRWTSLSTPESPAVPFLAAIGLAFAVWPLVPTENQSTTRIALAAIAAPLVLIVPLALSRSIPSVAQFVPLFGFFLVVALLRDGTGGAGSGYAPLVLLPVLWVALYAGRTQLALALGGVAVTLIAPIVLVGGPQYPVGELRRAILWVFVSATAGIAGQRLVAETRRLAEQAREAADAVREREEHYRLIIGTASDAFVSIDSQGLIRQWNRQAELIFGWRMDEAIGLRLAETIIPARYREAHERGLERLVKTGEGTVIGERLELTALDRRGHEFPVELCVWPVRTRGVLTFNAFVRDISERREADLELARSNADLERFAYAAAHDLQEPLRLVSGYLDLIARRYRGRLDRDADDFIAYAVDASARMQRLLEDMLAYARVQQQHARRTVDSEQSLASALANLRHAIEESAARITHCPLPVVQADASQLGQLFQNLIGNSIKFHNAKPPAIRVEAKEAEGEWVFSVQDNGIGFDPEDADWIFSLFKRLHGPAEYEGSGVGLSICKRIVERHGGRIWVRSAPGKGSTFFFTIPVVQTESPQPEAPPLLRPARRPERELAQAL